MSLAEQILEYLGETKAADIIAIIKSFFDELIAKLFPKKED